MIQLYDEICAFDVHSLTGEVYQQIHADKIVIDSEFVIFYQLDKVSSVFRLAAIAGFMEVEDES